MKNPLLSYITLGKLIAILPIDYLVELKDSETGVDIWTGISWVFPYSDVYKNYYKSGVIAFNTSFYNDKAQIEITVK